MSAFILHDRYFDPEAGRISSYFCQLFILIGQQSLQYTILDTDKNMFIALADYQLPSAPKTPEIFYSQIRELISEDEILQKKYHSVVIGLDSATHTLVPSPLFDKEQVKKYLEFNLIIQDDCMISAELIEEIDAYNIYGYPPGLKEVIQKYFKESAVVHRSSAFLRAAYHHHKINPGLSDVFLQVREQYIDLVVFNDDKLVFFNAFPFRTKEDLLYFTLYTIEQLRLSPDSLQLILSGLIDAGSESFLLLEQYIRNISFAGYLSNFRFSALISQAPSHRHQELFALALCGS